MREWARWLIALLLGMSTVASAQTYRVLVTLPGWSRRPTALDTMTTTFEIGAPSGSVFAALSAVLVELDIPTDIRDSVGGMLGNATLKKTYNFAGFQLSRLQECGMGATGPNANTYRVHMALVGFVDEDGPARTHLRIAFAAGATDLAGTSKEASSCRSTGALEARIADLVKQRVLITVLRQQDR